MLEKGRNWAGVPEPVLASQGPGTLVCNHKSSASICLAARCWAVVLSHGCQAQHRSGDAKQPRLVLRRGTDSFHGRVRENSYMFLLEQPELIQTPPVRMKGLNCPFSASRLCTCACPPALGLCGAGDRAGRAGRPWPRFLGVSWAFLQPRCLNLMPCIYSKMAFI